MSQGTRVNGPGSPTGKYIDTIDPDDPEYIRNLQRPAEVKEDMKQMEGRSRVSVVLNSQAFKEELEAVIQEQIRQGGPASLFALQQISDLLLPQSRGFNSSFARSSPVIPINDIRGVETLGYSKQEKVLRCKLASCYRLVDMFGWTHGIYNHISARVSQEQEQFLVNPFGMMYSEITASTLVKVNIRGEVVDSGSTGLGISKAAFNLHSAIHQARPDIRCIIHLHTPAAVAVSATKQGFLPISQEALICGKVSYHDYCGILVDQEERDLLARNMGPFNKIMFLRNHGVAACGETVEEAFHFAFNLMAACETQVKVMSVGVENLNLVDEETQEKTFKVANEGGGGVDSSGRKWRCGELEFEALVRTLDNAGYRTGHVYKQPLMKQEKKERINSDVEVPPASSSFTYIFDGDYEHSKYISPIKLAMERQKQAYKAGWLTSPNAYKKQEIEEIGTTTPKKITKWVQDGETPDQKSTAVKVDHPNQFAPQGSNPKEYKQKQKSIRKDYYEEKVTAGPQSRILDGISEWDEARTQDGDKTVVVGAASKGIIQRDHQHNAVVYRSYYAANPFENMTEEEIDAYKQDLERQERGEEAEDVVGPEGRLISSEERRQNIQQSQEDVQEDTEAKTAQHMPPDNLVSEERVVRQEERSPPPVSPKEPVVLSMPSASLPLAPSLEDLGLSGLVDTLLQAAINAALSSALSSSQPSPQEPGRPSENPIPFSSQLSPVSSPAPVQNTVDSGVGSSGEIVKASAQKIEVPVSESCGEVVNASAQKIEVPVSESELSEVPQIMTVQLQPTKLFQGKAGDGVMKISFSIQSKVTRRKGKGPKSSWPVENVTIMQTQPKVMMVQPAESHPPKVLQEQQNVAPVPCLQEGPAISVPLSPTCREKQYKRNTHPSSKRQGSTKLSKPRKRFSRWSRRGLTHPLSPVKEEFWDGDDTLEALLAQQNVQLDSDESLEDLLLMTDDYKENFGPKPQPDKSQAAASSTLMNKAAPIATVEDLDESGCLSPASVQPEKPQEEPLLVMNQVVNHSSPSDHGQSNHAHVKPDPSPPEQRPHTGDKTDKAGGEVLELRTKAIDTEDDIKFADEEMSSTFPEASDGDIAPRKQEGSVESLVQLQSAAESMDHFTKEATEGTKKVLPVPATYKAEEYVEKEDARQEGVDRKDSVTPSAGQTNQTEHETGITEMKCVQTAVTETHTSPQNTESEPEVASIPRLSPDPVISAPLAVQEEDSSDAASTATCSGEEEKTKASLFRTDSACLENSPIVSSPPFDAFPPDPIYRELHRVRSLEDELDDSSSVQRRLNKGHSAVRRVQSAYDSLPNKNRNVAVIDAVLHTVTIDPAKVVQSGLSVSKYLAGPADQTSASDDQKKKWTLMDSVTKSLEVLDVEDLAKEGSMIYGRSLEVLIQDGNASQNSTEMSQAKSQSSENVLESSTGKEKSTQRGTKLYKDDVVVITKKTPMDFSAISPQVRKDIAEEEGPLVTSSPKLGRRKEGSFKKYQSKMGKSEETLLEVAPLSPERTHQTAKRSKSFPKNYRLIKNRSREGLLDDGPSLQKSDKEREFRSSSQSVDEVSERNRRRTRPRRARNSDPVFSYSTMNALSQSDLRKRKTKEVYTRDTLSPARSAHSMEWDETHREEKEESRRRRRRHQSPEGGREQGRRRRRRERSEDNMETTDARVDDYPAQTQSLGRDRRKRRERSEENLETVDSRVDDYPAQTQSLGRDRRKRRERSEENLETVDSRVEDYPAQTQSLGRDRRKRRERSEENLETVDSRVEDNPAQTQSLGRDRRKRRERSEENLETVDSRVDDYPAQTQSLGRDRRKRRERSEENLETVDSRVEDNPAQTQSLGRDRRKRRERSEENLETVDSRVDDYPAQTQSLGRDRRKRRERSEENLETVDSRVDDYPAQTQSLGRDRRKRRERSEDNLETVDSRVEDYPAQTQSLGRDRRKRRERSEENLETVDSRVDDYPAQTQSLGRDRRKRRERSEDNLETVDSRVEDYPAQTQSLGRDRRKMRERSEENLETVDSRVDDYPAQTQSLGRDRRKRRERSEDNLETTDVRAEDYPAQTQSLERDRRRQQCRDVEETENTQITEALDREPEKKISETHISESTKPIAVTKKEERAGEGVPFTPVPHSEFQDEDFPPPPDNLHDDENQQEMVVDDIDHITTQQEEDQQLPAYPSRAEEKDEGEENQPPRVRKPRQPQSTETELTSADISTPKTDENMEENEVQRRRHKEKPETNPSAEETPFMSTFKQPVRNSQTLGEDFPSLSAKSDLVHSAVGNAEETDIDNDKATNDNKTGSLSTHLEPEGTVPIAGNLDILDYNEEANQENEQPQPSPTEDERSKASRARRRAERRQRGRSDSDKEKGRTSTGGRRGSRDSLISGESKVSSSRSSLIRQDSYDSKEPKERLGRRSSRESDQSKNLKENRVSRDSLTSKDLKNTRESRDSLARRGSQHSEIGALDIMNLDQEPPRAQRDRQERESTSRRNMSQGETEADNSEKPRSEGRIRGRRSGHGEGYPQNDQPRRSGRIYEEELQDIPMIKVQTASRQTLDREDFAPPLPPKQHRSRERLTELDREPRRSRSREMLDAPDSQSAPPELPPKKNRKSLSCVSGQGAERDDLPKKERRSKERSSSKDRKKMPPPPPPPVAEDYYSEEPRRRRRRNDSHHLSIPGDSFHRESSFDNSFDRNRNVPHSQKPRETGGMSYYGGTEDEFKKMVEEEATVSPPQTPRPARKISTSSYGSVSARIARSVSFDDGYTPTMSHAPRHSKSRESLGSEASYHSTSYRPRSYSGASETSVTSNPLNYEPWRAKAAAQRPHTRPSSSRSRRSHSQGEPTYSANAGRRRRSRTPSASDSNRLYQPRRTRSRTSLPDSPTRSTAPSGHSKSHETSLIADDSFSDAYSHGYASETMRPVPAPRSEPERRSQKNRQREGDGDKPGYIMDSASGGETLEERSSKEGSPTKEAPSPTKEKKKKKKFHMPSFSKKKKDSKESTL